MKFKDLIPTENILPSAPSPRSLLTQQKTQLYFQLSDRLVLYWKKDEELMETDPDLWQQVRIIDDWLYTYREDLRVGAEQYRKNCERLSAIFTTQETA